MDGIEYAAQVDKRRQHERRNDADAIEIFCINAVNEPAEREYERGEEEEEKHDERMRNDREREEKGDQEHEKADEHAAHDTACDEATDDDPGRGGGDQYLIDIP